MNRRKGGDLRLQESKAAAMSAIKQGAEKRAAMLHAQLFSTYLNGIRMSQIGN